jgi:hypothetical protein
MEGGVEEEGVKRLAWRRLELVIVSAFAVTLGCLFIGQTAQRYAMQLQARATQVAKTKPIFNAIDYATTGALKSGTVIIGPCDAPRP